MKFIEELWKLMQSDDLEGVRNITEEDLLHPERLGSTSYEKTITLLTIIISSIKQRNYEEASSNLTILSTVFNSMVEIKESPYDEFFKSLKVDEIWKKDKSLNQSLDMLSIICELNSIIKEHDEPRYWKINFWRLRSTAEKICFRPENYYDEEMFEQSFLNSVMKELLM